MTDDTKNSSVVIRVSDTGTGIPLELTEKIFDRFLQQKNRVKELGLDLHL